MSLTILDFECDQNTNCDNSVHNRGEIRAKCQLCRLSPEGAGLTKHFWRPINSRQDHPILKQEKFEKSIQKRKDAQEKRLNKDKGKRKMYRIAAKSEKAVESKIIKATKNSGRVNKDGDFKVKDFITLDNKLQTTRVNHEVDITELEKVNGDATRGGNLIGGLVLTNKNNYSVIVFKLEDFSREILSRLD